MPGNSHRMLTVVRSPWPRATVFAVLLLGCAWFALTQGTAAVDLLREWTADRGVLGAAVFVVLYALVVMALVPASVPAAVAGLLFGPVVGVLVVWLGAMLGAAASLAVGRALSRDAVEAFAGARLTRLNRFLEHRGALAMLVVRLISLFPFWLVNYGSAVTKLTFRQYLLGTGLGILPGIVVYVTLGGSFDDPTSPAFLFAAAGLALLIVGGGLLARRLVRH